MYRAEPITQRDGSPLQNSNCLMAAAATGLDFHTLGDQTSTGAKMRDYSGDTSGGTNTDEIERAWKTGYDQDPTTRDGRPWSDVLADLRAGRLVMLQVWHATTGGPCLSGSGAYGHGLAVAPEYDGQGRWLVADPWCKPPKWTYWPEDKLRDGAEDWYGRCVRDAGGQDVWSQLTWAQRRRIIVDLMTRYRPDRPADGDPPPSAGGGGGCLFASTKPHPEAADVSINTNGSDLASYRTVHVEAGRAFWADAGFTDKLGEFSSDRDVPFVGPVVGQDAWAVVVTTSRPYSDGEDRPTVVYVNPEYASGPDKLPPPVPNDDVQGAIDATNAAWRDWVRQMPDSMSVQVDDLPDLVAWAQSAPDQG